MSRIYTPQLPEAAPEKSRPLLKAVQSQLGSIPNLFRLVSNSPAALEGYLDFNGALAKGALEPQLREQIALAVAEFNGCGYCIAAHSYLGKLAKLSPEEIAAARRGTSSDSKAASAIAFARKLVEARGKVNEAEVETLKSAGFDDAEIVEIVAHVALNTLTNYMNEALGTEIDFPRAEALAA